MGELIDLTFTVEEGMITAPAPWHPVVEVTILGRYFLEGRASRKVVLGSHTGTHMDAPAHFIEGGLTIDKVPLDILTGPAKVIDMTHKGSLSKITVDDLKNCGIKLEKGDRIIIKTGWYKNWGTKKYFKEYPCFTSEAGKWLVQKEIALLALDTPSPDDPQAKLEFGEISPLHYIFLNNGIILVEYLTNTTRLNGNVKLTALPLKLKEGDGFPARVIAETDT